MFLSPDEIEAARARTEAPAPPEEKPAAGAQENKVKLPSIRKPQATEAPEPDPEPVTVTTEPGPTEPASPITAVLTRRPGPGSRAFDQDGTQLWPPVQAPPPAPDEPDEPVDESVVDASLYATSEMVLWAEGWQPPRPDFHEVLLQREALRLAYRRIKSLAGQDISLLSAAIRRADVDGIVAAAETNGLDMFLQSQSGSDSRLHSEARALEMRRAEMIWRDADPILRTLAGRHSRAAEALRAECLAAQRQSTPPKSVGMNSWLLR